MRNEYVPGQFNNYDKMNKQSTGDFNPLEARAEHGSNFYAFIISMEGDDPVGYEKEGFDSFSDAKGYVDSLGSISDEGGHRLTGFVAPAEHVDKAEARLNREISGAPASADASYPKEDMDRSGAYWAENSKKLFLAVREIYANFRAPEEHHIVSFLMEGMGVPENLAQSAVHAFNEVVQEQFNGLALKETTVATLLKMYKKFPKRAFTPREIGILQSPEGQDLTLEQASREVERLGFHLERDPKLQNLLRVGTSNSEARGGVNVYGQALPNVSGVRR